MSTIWIRFRYLWFILLGWALFFACVTIDSSITFWVGCLGALVLGACGIWSSAMRLGETTRDVIVHGIAWTLGVSLVFSAAAWMYVTFTG